MSFRKKFYNLVNSGLYLQQFTPEAKKHLLTKYRDSLGLTKEFTFGSEAFTEYESKKICDYAGFKTQVGTEKKETLEKLLKGQTHLALRNQVTDVFSPEPFYTGAKSTYMESMEAFKNKVNEIPERYSVEDVLSELKRVQNNAKNAIHAQQKIEKEKLSTLLNNEDFAQFLNGIGNTEQQSTKAKNDLIAELKKSHDTQLAEFNKSTEENITRLHTASMTEVQHLIFAGQLKKFSSHLTTEQKKQMQAEIERLRRENRGAQAIAPNTQALVNTKDKTISAINPKDLSFIISLTGKEIVHNKNSGVWTLEMPHRILNPLYYLSRKSTPKVDMLLMAQAIRASGFDRITMTINFSDEETRKQRSKQAYEACLESGFEPDKITLKDGNGTEIKPSDIFTPGELQAHLGSAQQTRADLEEMINNMPTKKATIKKTQQIKGEIFELRDKQRESKNKPHIDKTAEEKDEERIKTILSPSSTGGD